MSPKLSKVLKYLFSKYRSPGRQRRWFMMGKWEIMLHNIVMQLMVFEVDLSLLAVQNIFQNRHKTSMCQLESSLSCESIPSKG